MQRRGVRVFVWASLCVRSSYNNLFQTRQLFCFRCKLGAPTGGGLLCVLLIFYFFDCLFLLPAAFFFLFFSIRRFLRVHLAAISWVAGSYKNTRDGSHKLGRAYHTIPGIFCDFDAGGGPPPRIARSATEEVFFFLFLSRCFFFFSMWRLLLQTLTYVRTYVSSCC